MVHGFIWTCWLFSQYFWWLIDQYSLGIEATKLYRMDDHSQLGMVAKTNTGIHSNNQSCQFPYSKESRAPWVREDVKVLTCVFWDWGIIQSDAVIMYF